MMKGPHHTTIYQVDHSTCCYNGSLVKALVVAKSAGSEEDLPCMAGRQGL